MTQLFDTVERRTVGQAIVDQVKDLILQGRLKPSQKLPSERELSEQLGVGRSSVREATSALLALGIIEIRPGEGVYVRADFPQSVLKSVDWSTLMLNQHSNDLFEARIAVETSTARLAALRATQEAQERLYQLCRQMAKAATLDEFITLDLEFHLALAEASENPVLRDIIAGIQNLMRSSMLHVLQSEEMRKLSLEQHRSLCEAISEGAPEKAEHVMRTHLEKDLVSFANSNAD